MGDADADKGTDSEAVEVAMLCTFGSDAMRCILAPTVHVIRKRFMNSGGIAGGLSRAQRARWRQVR